MRCFRCGAAVPESSIYCGMCGTQVLDPETTTAVLPEDPESLLRTVRHVFAGEYEVEREVGRGGMAVVFQATELALDRPVALKVLPPEAGVTVKAAERFKREARLVAELDHPNITPVYRAGQVGGILHIVMKFVEGRSLDRIIEDQGALPVPVVLAVLRAAARALTYAHDRDIIHRDVKSANILVDRDGRVLVSDFGAALRASDVTLTAAGALIGTPAFMSPEQCAGRRALPQSDQYSLGIVAFQMLTGSVPFGAETLAGLMQHHFFTPPPDLVRVRPTLAPVLTELVGRMLAKDPKQRFGTTREMLAAVNAVPFQETERHQSEVLLRELARGTVIDRVRTEEIPAPPDLPTLLVEAPRRRHGQRSLLRAASVVGAVVLIGSAAIWASGAGNGPPPGTTGDTVATPAAPAASTVLSPPARDAAAPPPQRAAPRPPGNLRMLTSPPTAEILLDGRPMGVGSYFAVVAAGNRRISVRAAGYRPFDTTLIVAPGALVNLGTVVLEAVAPE